MIKREKRADDNGSEDGYRQRRFFNNGTIIKMLTAMIIGGGATGGVTLLSSSDHTTIELNKQEVIRLREQLTAHYGSEKQQEQLFDSKLKNLETKIDGINSKLDLLIREMERNR